MLDTCHLMKRTPRRSDFNIDFTARLKITRVIYLHYINGIAVYNEIRSTCPQYSITMVRVTRFLWHNIRNIEKQNYFFKSVKKIRKPSICRAQKVLRTCAESHYLQNITAPTIYMLPLLGDDNPFQLENARNITLAQTY